MPNEKNWTPEALLPGLTVSRLPGQSVTIGAVVVQVLKVRGKEVRLHIAAPPEMKITRSHYVPRDAGPEPAERARPGAEPHVVRTND